MELRQIRSMSPPSQYVFQLQHLCKTNLLQQFPNNIFHINFCILTNPQQSMKMILAAKAHKAKCLKILTQARQSIEEESEKLLDAFSKISLEYSSDLAEPKTYPPGHTPSPTNQFRTGYCFYISWYNASPYRLCTKSIFMLILLTLYRCQHPTPARSTKQTGMRCTFIFTRTRI